MSTLKDKRDRDKREREKIVKKEKDERRKKAGGIKEEEEHTFVIAKLLKGGTYNCAHLLKDKNEVLRIARFAVNKEDGNRMVKRGLDIVHAMNAVALRPLLGPSMLQELSKYQIVSKDDLQNLVRGEMCLAVEEGDDYDQYGLQHIEYLAGGEFNNSSKISLILTKDDVLFSLFSLVWFLASAQQYLGFRHHDLKAENIMFRRTGEKQTYSFHLHGEKDRYYKFQTDIVPVVIDYDFATVDTTRDIEQRTFLGTYYTCSPDSLMNDICIENERKNIKVYNEEVRDFWAVGICMTHLMLNFERPWALFQDHCEKFATNAMNYYNRPSQNFELKNEDSARKLSRKYFQWLFYACCWQSIVLYEPRRNLVQLAPSGEWYMFVENSLWKSWNIVMSQDQEYRAVLVAFNALDGPLKSILRTLMNEDPGERNKHDMPAKLLTHPYFGGTTKPNPQTNYTYNIEILKMLTDTSHLKHVITKYHPWIENALCSSCADPNKRESYWCKCCNRVFCGELCQIKNH